LTSDIKFLGPLLHEQRVLGEVEKMKTALGQSGYDVSPQKLGALPGMDGSGTLRFDSVDLMDRHANAVRLLSLSQQGVIELDKSR
jgi:hypothetical protein